MTAQRKRIVIVGATSAIAEHCARLWAAQGAVDFVLLGRDTQRMSRISADLQVRNPSASVAVHALNFSEPQAIGAMAQQISASGPVDIVLVAHGCLPEQVQCQTDLSVCADALFVNGASAALVAEAFAGAMERAGRGTLGVIGSVAGDRGRKSNYAYGAAKGLVARYVQGLQHRLAATAVRVVLIKPGPTATPMTAQLTAAGIRMASVEQVAARIVAGMARGDRVVYAPAKWAPIMLIVRLMPDFIFDRLDI